jgi:TatA/E family protein of Tat protein translocase
MGPLGWQETIFIFVLALLIFGPKKLPELGKTIGKAMTEFRRASSELRSTWDREMASMERETQSLKEETRKIEGEISASLHDGTDHYNSYYDSGYEYGGYGSESQTTTASIEAGSETTVGDAAVQAAEQTAPAPGLAASSGEAVPNAASGNATAHVPEPPAPGKDVRA